MNPNTVKLNIEPPLKTNLCVFFFLLSFILSPNKTSCSVDRRYEACREPKSCEDGQNISFPFYIKDHQEPFCGFPYFELSCNTKGKPVLKLPDNEYIVQHISYNNQSLRVSNAIFSDTNNNGSTSVCYDAVETSQNLSLPQGRFELLSNRTKLFLLRDCNLTGAGNLSEYNTGDCGGEIGETGVNSTLAVYDSDPLLGFAAGRCARGVAVPVEDGGGGRLRSGVAGGVDGALRDGFWLKWIASNCSVCEKSGGKCGFDQTIVQFQCYCPDRPHFRWCTKPTDTKGLKLKLGLGIGSAAILIIILSTLLIIQYHKRRRYNSEVISGNISSDPYSKSDIEGGNVYFGVPIFSYRELEEATDNFRSDRLLGDGGFGTVYYGKLRDGREVAVKRLYEHNYRRVEQFMNEVEILTRLRHKNLVSLYGCTSRRSSELLLVYEFVHNGTVADHLHGDLAKSSSLSWTIRMNIAVETADALAYLHASDIIHRDVKTNNILLDRNFCVKVADFGLSRLFPNDVTHVSTAPQGTPGYVDPEYHQCYQLTDKSDVYSFGVVLVELISSMVAVDTNRHKHEVNLSNLAINKIQKHAFDELIDPDLGYKTDEEVKNMTRLVAELAFRCLQQDKEMRPSMDEVLQELKRIQSREYKSQNQEVNCDDKEVTERRQPPPSPTDYDEASLLKNIRLPPSPVSVTAQWVSTSTTPNTSG